MDRSFEWRNPQDPIPVQMTVALPAYKAKRSIWLALESLRRQVDLTFGWELMVMEEHGESVDIVSQFVGKLPYCQRIWYKAVDPNKDGRKKGENKGKVTLIDKWVRMAQERSPTSLIYVMHASDDYSPPKRLVTHYKHFMTDKTCIFSTQWRGFFYQIATKKKIIYDGRTLPHARTHLNMAYRMKYFAKVHNRTDKTRGIDSYIRMCIEEQTGKKFHKSQIRFADETEPGIWKSGFFTDGCNTISKSRRKFYTDIKPPYVKYKSDYQVWERLPEQVRTYLDGLHLYLNKKTTAPPAIPETPDLVVVKPES